MICGHSQGADSAPDAFRISSIGDGTMVPVNGDGPDILNAWLYSRVVPKYAAAIEDAFMDIRTNSPGIDFIGGILAEAESRQRFSLVVWTLLEKRALVNKRIWPHPVTSIILGGDKDKTYAYFGIR
jgi:hypothetical protein